jgi:prepilin-type N-terminal cleavage/methylation domain-containing protein
MHIKTDLRSRNRSAFSLLELMIVIIIISLVYALTFSAMRKSQKEPKALQVSNMKSILLEQNLSHTESEFFCLDKCSRCYLYQDGETTEYGGKVTLGDLTVYTIDRSDKLEKVDFGRYHDHRVCLRFKLHYNGSSSQMVIQNKSGIYYLPALFGETVKADSLEEAEKLWLEYADLLKDRGAYY